jgi:hypothetical protein
MTVCFGACTRRPASVRTVNSPSRATAKILHGSATGRGTANEQPFHIGVVASNLVFEQNSVATEHLARIRNDLASQARVVQVPISLIERCKG